MKTRNLLTALCCVIAFNLTGCLSVGKAYDTTAVDRFILNQTTANEVVEVLGPPYSITKSSGSNNITTYIYMNIQSGGLSNQRTHTTLLLRFNEAGVLVFKQSRDLSSAS